MKPIIILTSFSCLLLIFACDPNSFRNKNSISDSLANKDTVAIKDSAELDSKLDKKDSLSLVAAGDSVNVEPIKPGENIAVGDVDPEELLKFAESLVGTPYVYGSTDPKIGFDCSGFITYVFNHFKIKVPRSSVQFTHMGETIPIERAKRGDIILFTDPDPDNSTSTEAGHIGLITSNENNVISFIHSTSGNAMSVTITPMSEHYRKRFVRVARVFSKTN
jgi:cell wall-associated NlpC family hydrolase